MTMLLFFIIVATVCACVKLGWVAGVGIGAALIVLMPLKRVEGPPPTLPAVQRPAVPAPQASVVIAPPAVAQKVAT